MIIILSLNQMKAGFKAVASMGTYRFMKILLQPKKISMHAAITNSCYWLKEIIFL